MQHLVENLWKLIGLTFSLEMGGGGRSRISETISAIFVTPYWKTKNLISQIPKGLVTIYVYNYEVFLLYVSFHVVFVKQGNWRFRNFRYNTYYFKALFPVHVSFYVIFGNTKATEGFVTIPLFKRLFSCVQHFMLYTSKPFFNIHIYKVFLRFSEKDRVLSLKDKCALSERQECSHRNIGCSHWKLSLLSLKERIKCSHWKI